MKNVTLSAEEHLIEQARQIAQARHTTLNEAFRQWLATYTAERGNPQEFDAFISRVGAYAKAGGHFTRDELNER
jgi:hypothetical protein